MPTAPRTLALLAALLVAACSATTDPGTRTAERAIVQSVVPAGGATGVDPTAPITVRFNHPMMQGMEMLVVLHEGSVTGPQVEGAAAWSTDRTQLTFTPTAPLKPSTTYVLHFSPNMKDASGNTLDWQRCAGAVGGTAANGGMFGGGMMGSGMGPGMMGAGWQPTSGAWGYGMLVTFTTA